MAPALADATWPEVARSAVVLVPVGAVEQHGPHLPLDTDTVIAEAVARAVAAAVPDAWVAPPLSYGASGEHQAFAGTSSIGSEALHHVVVELVRSMRRWARRVVLVNGHGGNVAALTAAVDQLVAERHDVALVSCATEDAVDAHAGRTETSLMLHLRPEAVRLRLAEAGNTAPIAQLMPYLVTGGVRSVSVNGVLGDPAGASAEEGCRLLAGIVEGVRGRLVEAPVS
jgi:creatinine amidohydrolase